MSGTQGAVAGTVFIVLAAITVYVMLEASAHPAGSPVRARLVAIHRYLGYAFLLLFCIMTYFMLMRLKGLAEEPSAHLVVHMLFAFLLAPLLFAKVLIARFYKQHYSALLPLGVAIFAISFAQVTIMLVPHVLAHFEPGRLPAVWSFGVLLVIAVGVGSLAWFRPRSKGPSPDMVEERTSGDVVEQAKRRTSGALLHLARIEQQGRDARTLRFLVPEGSRFDARPGQFLTFRWSIEGSEIRRSYSICSSPTQNAYVEITPKRVLNGRVSNFLNTEATVGLTVEAEGPFGQFYFDETKHERVLLIAGGSGITPILSILRYIHDRRLKTPVTLIYCARTREDIFFKAELLELELRLEHFRLTVVLSQPEYDWAGPRGHITRDILADQDIDLPSATAFLCGPSSFMDSVEGMLDALGVPPEKIKRENFGAADRQVDSRSPEEAEPVRVVEFTLSRAVWDVSHGETLLEVAERNNIDIPFSCRQGQCGTCATRLLAGRVDMSCEDGLTPAQKADGFVLMCVARPRGNVKVEA